MNVFKQSNLEEIKDLIDKKLPKNIENVLVYNVGQGNCNAITNYRCKPHIFFDFGGGAYQNTRTYPNNLEFDFSEEPLVILSHWDWDHMASILKSEHADIKKSIWIVPKQQIGITHLKVAVELYNSGKLKDYKATVDKLINGLIEDEQLDILSLGQLRIIKRILTSEISNIYHKRIDYEEETSKQD